MSRKLISVTRILNEDDIVEAFVRHNSALLDGMIFLDDGSVDRSVEILKMLAAEGVPITIYRRESVIFDEIAMNTLLYVFADTEFSPDWVLFLDADEFIDTGEPVMTRAGLRGLLAEQPERLAVRGVDLINYAAAPGRAGIPLITERAMWRQRGEAAVRKIFLRGGLRWRGVTVDAGNHGAFERGKEMAVFCAPAPRLAHFPRRGGWRDISRCTIGVLKVLAAGEGEVEAGRSKHYWPVLEALKERPQELLSNPSYLDEPPIDETKYEKIPLAYLGGRLRYTSTEDPKLRAMRLTIVYMERLARSHGALLDNLAGARELIGSRSIVNGQDDAPIAPD